MGKTFENMASRYLERAKGVSPRLSFELKEKYSPDDIEGTDYRRDLGNPGSYPYTRGVHEKMYRGRLWTMRELVGHSSPTRTRQRVKDLARQGASAISIIGDVPTYLGLDADHPLALEQVGREGIPLSTILDMEAFLKGIPMEKISIGLICSTAVAPIILAQFVAVAEKRRIDIAALRGTSNNDPIKAFYAGYQPVAKELDLCLKLAADLIEYGANKMPLWTTHNSNFSQFQCWAVTESQEIAYTFALTLAYIDETLQRGVSIERIARRIAFFSGIDLNFFEEIAKIRAARRLWARVMRERYGVDDLRSCQFRVGVWTAGYQLVPQEPLNNIIRITLECLAGVLAGAQSIHVCGYDEPVALPTAKSHRLALRTQQIIAYESGVANVADPLGGSYYLEFLTNRIEEEAKAILEEIENIGGIINAIESGYLGRKLEEAVIRRYKAIEAKEQIVVASNSFMAEGKEPKHVTAFRVSQKEAMKQIEKLKKLKRERDNSTVKRCLHKLRDKASGKRNGENLMPYIIEAVKTYCTIGEIFGSIRQGFGYQYDPLGINDSPFDK